MAKGKRHAHATCHYMSFRNGQQGGQRGRLILYLLHMVDNGSLGPFYHIVAPRRGMRGTVASVQNIYIYRK
jgi:hypothetical protein